MSSAMLREHSLNPHKMHALEAANAHGQAGTPGEGPHMRIHLRIHDDVVEEAAFETYGCPSAIACGSWLTLWAEGRAIALVQSIEPEQLSQVLGGLPLGKEHCAQLAVSALHLALTDWQKTASTSQAGR